MTDGSPSAENLRTAMALALRDFDLPDVRRAHVEFAIADVDSPLNMEHIPESESWYVEGERRILLKVADSVADVTISDLEEYKVVVASYLQDFVVDRTGQPWPEKVIGGHSRVLDVALDNLGKAVWAYAGQTIASVGQLHQS